MVEKVLIQSSIKKVYRVNATPVKGEKKRWSFRMGQHLKLLRAKFKGATFYYGNLNDLQNAFHEEFQKGGDKTILLVDNIVTKRNISRHTAMTVESYKGSIGLHILNSIKKHDLTNKIE